MENIRFNATFEIRDYILEKLDEKYPHEKYPDQIYDFVILDGYDLYNLNFLADVLSDEEIVLIFKEYRRLNALRKK